MDGSALLRKFLPEAPLVSKVVSQIKVAPECIMHSTTFGINNSKGKAGATSEAQVLARLVGHQWWEVNWRLRSRQWSYVQSYECSCPSNWRGWNQSREVSALYRLLHLYAFASRQFPYQGEVAAPLLPDPVGFSMPCIPSQRTKASNQPVLVVSFGYIPKPWPPCS